MTLKYVYENLLIRQLLQKKEETGTQGSYCTQFSKFGRIFLWIKNILKFISVSLRWEKRGILLTKTSPVKLKSDYMAFRNKQKVHFIKIMHSMKITSIAY